MEYQVIYDFKTSGLSAFLFPLVGIVFWPTVFYVLLSDDKKKYETNNWMRAISKRTIAVGLFGTVWISFVTIGIVGDHIRLLQVVDSDKVSTIEGVVENVTRISRCRDKTRDRVHDGEGNESFQIDGHFFEYSVSVSSAFNGGNCHGPIKNGMKLKVTYHINSNSILKLEEILTPRI